MAVAVWAIVVGLLVLVVAVHAHYDRRERTDGVKPSPRWLRDAMDRWGGGFD